MSMIHLRQRGAHLVQSYHNGILSLLPHAFGGNRRNYNWGQTGVTRRKDLLRGTERLIKSIRHASGIIKSPVGTISPIPNQNLVEYLYSDMDEHIEEPATTCAVSGRSYTYGFLRMLINRCAQALLGHCGLRQGDVIGLLLPNIPEYIIVCHGAMEAGIVVTFVNPLYTPDEIKRQFENAGVKMIVTVPLLLEVATTVGPQLPGYKSTLCIGGEDDIANNVHGLENLLKAGHESEIQGINPRELALLPYSSGTTGLPKGVMLSHYNLVANLVQVDHDAFRNLYTHDGSRHKVLTVLPYFHIYGFNSIMNLILKSGGHLLSIPRFTPEDYIKALVEYRPTFLFVVPSLLLFLASHPAVTKEHLSSIEAIQSGAAPLSEAQLQKFREKVGRDDVLIRQGYGMTESSPVTFIMPRITPPSKIGTIGVPVPSTEAKIISLTNGETLGTHESGELLVRGPQVMMGYLNNEQATSETIDEEGWLHTGDVAYYDEDAYFYIVDRCKELIKVKGNQVSLKGECKTVSLAAPYIHIYLSCKRPHKLDAVQRNLTAHVPKPVRVQMNIF
nr:unnamed protein product [Callosobruchus analis]